jgi:UDP-N-acetylmuramate--alanine ligase
MIASVNDFKQVFFIGIAGTGMSAIAQYLQGTGKAVAGSDRYFVEGEFNETKAKLEAAGISCYFQDGKGISAETDLVVVSTAIEDTVMEVQKARSLGIPIMKRSEVLALIAGSRKTIAVGGTSGKSTTSAMLFQVMEKAGLSPSIISGAGLVSIIKESFPNDTAKVGKIGNAKVGSGDWLIIEADESDGSIVQYHPEVGLLLNIDKDHQEIEELEKIFSVFRENSRTLFVVNQSNEYARKLSVNNANDFSLSVDTDAGYRATAFVQDGLHIAFMINGVQFGLNTVGRLNMENALAAVAVANQLGVSLETCAAALQDYEGIYRRHQVLGQKENVWVIDDYAHNPVKCARSIEACQPVSGKVVAWFQPHGYGPTRFLRNDFVKEIAAVLRPQDEIWMSEIFYAGGTAVKDISAEDLINDIKALGKQAFFISDLKDFLNTVRPHLENNKTLLLKGALDPSLESFGKQVFAQL